MVRETTGGGVLEALSAEGCGFGASPLTRRRPVPAVCVRAAARLDFGGGWTDVPPYSVERGGTVLNAAVTLRGQYPIEVDCVRLPEPRLVLECADTHRTVELRFAGDVLGYADPADPFALPKAALVLCGVVPDTADPSAPLADLLPDGRGFALSTRTSIPPGSGLGTSSIMAGAVLTGLARVTGRPLSTKRLFHEVLCLDQMLAAGGGWQDQVGGLTGGIKLVTSSPGLPQCLHTERAELTAAARAQLDERLVLVYTGQQSLAKDLVRAAMSRLMAREQEMAWIMAEVARLARCMRDLLERGDMDGFGCLLADHWDLSKLMDPACTDPFIDELFGAMAPFISGGKLAGAGGGGFALVIAREGARAALLRALERRFGGTPVAVWECKIPEEAVIVE